MSVLLLLLLLLALSPVDRRESADIGAIESDVIILSDDRFELGKSRVSSEVDVSYAYLFYLF